MKRRSQQNPEQKDGLTGSPQPGEPVFIAVGFLRRSHGVKGEMIMDVLTAYPERLRAGRKVYVGDQHELVEIKSVRWHIPAMLVRLAGCETPEDTATYRNKTVFVRVDELPPLPEGEYYHHQLIGLSIVNESGEALGVLEQILETGANDVYLVRRVDGSELLLPAIEDVIVKVDLERKEIVVRLQDWS